MVPTTALELYRTDRINKNATLCQFIYYDCLLYHVSDTIVAYGSVGARGIIPYCMRPLAAKNISEERSGHVGEVILFEYLRKDGVREEDLLSWSAPVDLVEMYWLSLRVHIRDRPRIFRRHCYRNISGEKTTLE
jgi:hypothetical protein